MKAIFKNELKLNIKSLMIWSLAVGGMGLACVLLYQSMEGDMKAMADAFSNMGAFSDAFGMSTLSIATLTGYFATEVGTVHGLGGGMFAAITAIGILSKEEECHTGEFLLSFPVSRTKVAAAKGICTVIMIAAFTLICGVLYAAGFAMLGEELPVGDFVNFMGKQMLMNLEIAAICFAISAVSGKTKTGLGLGLTLLFYFYDIIGRVVPDLKDSLFIGPYSYANASEIFSGKETTAASIITACMIIVLCGALAHILYNRRDLAG